jgi:hypothetical protein
MVIKGHHVQSVIRTYSRKLESASAARVARNGGSGPDGGAANAPVETGGRELLMDRLVSDALSRAYLNSSPYGHASAENSPAGDRGGGLPVVERRDPIMEAVMAHALVRGGKESGPGGGS